SVQVASEEDIENTLNRFYGAEKKGLDGNGKFKDVIEELTREHVEVAAKEDAVVEADAPLIKLVNELIVDEFIMRASEIHQQTFERLIGLPDGILLVTGPTGSGKTTTLYSCLNFINRPDRKIITVEDPVEYLLSGINQVQVAESVGLSFAAALRAILRQAPNVIMIGEIRDLETATIAINASLTGHLVFSTLHTNDAPSAVTRLIDIGVKPFLVASSTRALMA